MRRHFPLDQVLDLEIEEDESVSYLQEMYMKVVRPGDEPTS